MSYVDVLFFAQVLGGVGIFDLEGLTINHGLLITPSVASKIICLMVVSTKNDLIERLLLQKKKYN